MEIWKDIERYEGLYQVSNIGRIKSVDRSVIKSDGMPNFIKGRLKSPSLHNRGYLRIFLYRDAKIKSFYTHRLVAIHFIPNPENKPEVNHKDGDKLNNHWTNLEWSTSSENSQHALRTGLTTPQKGEDSSRARLTEKQAIHIKYHTNGLKHTEVAKKYGVNPMVVWAIKHEKSWKHI